MAIVISSGTSTVKSGTLLKPDIYNSGTVVVSSGGIVSSANIHNGGRENVLSGGSDIDAYVYSAGALNVMVSGHAYNPYVISKGYISAMGGKIFGGTIGSSGVMDISGWSSGGSLVYGYANNVRILNGGQMLLTHYATGSDVKVSSGYVYIFSGGFLQESVIGGVSGSAKNAEVNVNANASAHLNQIQSNGIMYVSSGGTATSTKVYSGGSLVASTGGVLRYTSAFGGVVDVKPGGNATSTTIESNGGFYVSTGATVSSTTITSGRMYLMSSATAYETILKAGTFTNYADSISGTFSGGTAYLSGGSSYHEKLLGGVMEVSSYGGSRGYAYDITISAATVYLNADTNLNFGFVYSGGKVYVYEGARASSVNVYGGGDVFVKNGGYLSGGSIYYGSETIMSGGTAYGMNVMLNGTLDVRGRAYNCTVSSGGKVLVSSGARFTADLMSSGARISAMSGGTASIAKMVGGSAVVSGGSVYVSEGTMDYAGLHGGQLHISGGKIIDAFISAGTLAIQNGASATSALVVAGSDVANLTINPGGFLGAANVSGGSARLNIGGTVDTANVLLGASATIDGRVITSCYIASDASAVISSGGSANYVTVVKDSFLKIRYGGKASIITIGSGGDLTVSSGGIALETTVGSSGVMTISSGGKVESGVTVTSGGWLRIASSGYADAVVLNKNGEMKIEGGTIMNLLVMKDCRAIISGGSIVSATLANGGSAFCYKTGRMAGTVSSGGTAVFSGGMATGLSVISGGKVRIADNLSMLDGDAIAFNAGGILDFDISNITASSYTALLTGYNDHILYGGDAVYTLTVDGYGSQKDMTYLLASNASLFNSTIAVQDTFGTSLGTLTVGGTTKIGDKDYTLNLDGDNVLSVSVAAAQMAGSAKSDIDGNGTSDVLFQYTGGQGQIGFWMNGTSTWQSTNSTHPTDVWEVLGAYDMNANGKADSVLVGNTEVSGIKGAFIGYYLDAEDFDSNWVNISYLTNYEGYVWKNKVGNLTGNAGMNSIVWHTTDIGALGVWTDGTDSWVSLGAGYDSNWALVGCGDFTGSGKDTVVMSYAGGVKYYTVRIDGVASELATSDTGWEVRAIGDFAGDGKDDIVAFHKETGLVAMWSDGDSSKWSQLGQLDPNDWFIAGAGDYTGDQKDDLLVRQKSTGMLGYYSAANMDDWVELGRGVDMNWTVIA